MSDTLRTVLKVIGANAELIKASADTMVASSNRIVFLATNLKDRIARYETESGQNWIKETDASSWAFQIRVSELKQMVEDLDRNKHSLQWECDKLYRIDEQVIGLWDSLGGTTGRRG